MLLKETGTTLSSTQVFTNVLPRVYTPCLYVLNKIDAITIEELDLLDQIPHYVPVSAHLEWNLDELLERAWDYLNLNRVYVCICFVALIYIL